MSRIYEAIRDAQKSLERDNDTNSSIQLEQKEASFFQCSSIDGSFGVRLLEDGLPLPKQSSAAGILLGKTDERSECNLIVECHARIPGAQKIGPFGDLFHLDAFVNRWNLNPSRSLKIVGLYRITEEGQEGLTHQDLVILKAIERQTPLVFLLVQSVQSGCHLHLFVVKQGSVVASWTLPNKEKKKLLPEAPPSLSVLNKPGVDLPRASREIRPVEKRLPRRTWLYSAAVAAIVAVAILGLFGGRATRGISASANNAEMGLRLAREGSDWRLSWDVNSPVIRDAISGQLFIQDGNLEKRLELETADLKGGAILYYAATNDLVFKLQIETGDFRKSTTQSVRAVDNLVSVANSSPGLFTAEPAITVRPESSPAKGPNDPLRMLPKAPTTNLFRRSTPMERMTKLSESPIVPPELSLSTAQDSSHSDPLGAILLGAELGSPPSPNGGAHFQPAQLMLRREPMYPAGANGIDGLVKLQFLITKAGMVRDVKVISGNPILGAAAKAAVGMWRYKPASEDGTPIQTEGMAIINFDRHSVLP